MVTRKLKSNYISEVLPWGENSKLYVSLPSLGVWHWEQELTEHLAWRPAELDCRSSTGLGETETLLLENADKVPCTLSPSTKAVTPQEPGDSFTWWSWRVTWVRQGMAVALSWDIKLEVNISWSNHLKGDILLRALAPRPHPTQQPISKPQKFPQFLWEHKRLQIAKAILKMKNGMQESGFLDLRLYHKATVIKTWFQHKNRNIDQWNRIESPEIKPHTYSQLSYDKGGKNIQWRKESNLSWENWTATNQGMKLEHSVTPCTTINSKWIKDLKVRADTIKLLEENIGKTLFDKNRSNGRNICNWQGVNLQNIQTAQYQKPNKAPSKNGLKL